MIECWRYWIKIILFLAVCIALNPARMVQANPSISLCFFELTPHSFMENGKAKGLSIDIMREAALRAGFVPEFTPRPWTRCLKEVKAGEFHGTLDATARPGFVPSNHVTMQFDLGVAVLEDSPLKQFDGLSSLDGLTGLFLADALLPEALLHYDGYQKLETYSVQSVLRMLKNKRGDFTFVDFATSRFWSKNNPGNIRLLDPPLSILEVGPLFGPDQELIRDAIDTSLAKMKKDGGMDMIYQEWLGLSFQEFLDQARSYERDGLPTN